MAIDTVDDGESSVVLSAVFEHDAVRWTIPKPVVVALLTRLFVNTSSSDFCDPFGFCQGVLQQIEFAGAVIVRF